MRRWAIALLVVGSIIIPTTGHAQTPVVLSGLVVQLWPEYDQPSMLVLYDFQVDASTQLPIGITIRFPKEANLTAVAVHGEQDALMNADYRKSSGDDKWQSIIVQVQSPATYRVEYVQPLSRTGNQRQFVYAWPGDYAVGDFNVNVRMPADAGAVTTQPKLQTGDTAGATYYLGDDFGALGKGAAFTLDLSYSRVSESPVASPELAPSQPLGGNTPGRVMLSNYLPYILGLLGILLIGGGAAYFWQSSRARAPREKRRHGAAQAAAQTDSDIYCHQCGTRAQPGDRFCRVCGARLRLSE